MPTNSQPTQTSENDKHVFEFKNEMLLLPEHTESDFPENDFTAQGTSDEDLQF